MGGAMAQAGSQPCNERGDDGLLYVMVSLLAVCDERTERGRLRGVTVGILMQISPSACALGTRAKDGTNELSRGVFTL